jgi:hypothetical protein
MVVEEYNFIFFKKLFDYTDDSRGFYTGSMEEWEPDKFNWHSSSRLLTASLPDKFLDWWDPDRYNWEDCADMLPDICGKHITHWLNNETAKYFKEHPIISKLIEIDFDFNDKQTLEYYWKIVSE